MPKSRLRLLARGDITYHRQDRTFTLGLDRAEHDVDGKFSAIFPPSIKLEPAAHRTWPGRHGIVGPELRMMSAKPFRYQNLYQIPNQLGLRVAEELFRSRIGRGDPAGGRGYNDGIRRSEEELLEQRQCMLRSILVGHVHTHRSLTTCS